MTHAISDAELDNTWHGHGARATADLLKLGELSMPIEWSADRCRDATHQRLASWDALPHVRDGVLSYL
jgi:hypothetical protein